MSDMIGELITVEELCEILRIGKNAAYKLPASGKLKCFRMSRTWNIPREGAGRSIREKRDMETKILALARKFACIVLTRARQVGKTTLLKALDGNRHYVTLDDLDRRRLAKTEPATFLAVHPCTILTLRPARYGNIKSQNVEKAHSAYGFYQP